MKRLSSIVLFFILINTVLSQHSGFLSFRTIESFTGYTSLIALSYQSNPSSVHLVDSSVLNLAYTPSRFNMPELSPAYLFYGLRLDSAFVTGCSLYALGNELYSELSAIAQVSYDISDMIVFGISAEYGNISIKSYQSDYVIKVNMGGHIILTDIMAAAFCFSNVNGDSYFGEESPLQRKAAFAFVIKLPDGISVELGALISIKRKSGGNLTLKYAYNDMLSGRLGYSSNPARAETAVRFGWGKSFFSLVQLSYHSYLGFQSGFALGMYL